MSKKGIIDLEKARIFRKVNKEREAEPVLPMEKTLEKNIEREKEILEATEIKVPEVLKEAYDKFQEECDKYVEDHMGDTPAMAGDFLRMQSDFQKMKSSEYYGDPKTEEFTCSMHNPIKKGLTGPTGRPGLKGVKYEEEDAGTVPALRFIENGNQVFDDILTEMAILHKKKNTDYGDAWHIEFEEFGPIIGVIRLYEKVNRLKSLHKNGKALVGDESFEDTLIDIANYAVMTLSEMRRAKNNN